jgi:hypothetical protein
MTTLAGVVQNLQLQRRQVLSNLERIDDALKAIQGLTTGNATTSSGRTMSVAARNRIAAAQRARWAKWKKARKAA